MMRISPVGFLFNSEEDVIKNAKLATIPTHNSTEAIDSATKIALLIYYLRGGYSKEEAFKKLNLEVSYHPFTKFNTTCSETINNCLYVLYHSTGFENAVKGAVQMGGDTDTNACIVASLAEAAYAVDEKLIEKANKKLPEDFKKVLSKTRNYYI